MSPNSWLSDVVVLNESHHFDQPGDVAVFRNLEDMCDRLEHWFVEQNLGFAMSGVGIPVELSTDGRRVFATIVDQQKARPETLKNWLMALATSVHDARVQQAAKRRWQPFGSVTNLGLAEKAGVLPQSIEGLIAYVSMK